MMRYVSRSYSRNEKYGARLVSRVDLGGKTLPLLIHRAGVAAGSVFGGTRAVRNGLLCLGLGGVILLRCAGLPGAIASDGPFAQSKVDYRLGAQDRLRIRVFEWRPAKDEIFEWAALNAEYTIGATGMLSLPLVGEIQASGVPTSELARAIGTRLRERMGLASEPDTSIEVIQFRPFYIVGEVQKPGEYAFRPGLTLLQALSIGGGLRRSTDMTGRLEREILTTRGDLNLYAKEFNSLLARRARLEAELNGADQIDFPATLLEQRVDPEVKKLLSNETLIFNTRRDAYQTQAVALRQLSSYLEQTLEALNGQVNTHGTVTKIAQTELSGVETLLAKGLATQPRRLALQRNVALIEGDGLRLGTELMRTRQDMNRAEISLIELRNKKTTDITAELQVTQQKLEQLVVKSDTAQRLLYESAVIAPVTLASRGERPSSQPIYKVIRNFPGTGPREITATDSTMLEPGDTINVEVPMPPMTGGSMQIRWDMLRQQTSLPDDLIAAKTR